MLTAFVTGVIYTRGIARSRNFPVHQLTLPYHQECCLQKLHYTLLITPVRMVNGMHCLLRLEFLWQAPEW